MSFLSIKGRKLFVVHTKAQQNVQSTTSPTTFLFIHGLGSSHSFYSPVMESLAASGYSSIAFDTYGSGLSQLSQDGEAPSIKSIAQDAKEILESLEIPTDQVIAVGHSMGGITVPELCVENKFKAAVLIGPVLPRPSLADIFTKRIETVSKGGMITMASTIPQAATGSKSTSTHRAFIRALILSQKETGYNSLCQAIAKAERPTYSKAQCPLLIIAGAQDKTSPVADSEVILEEWGVESKSKSIAKLEGVGHWHCVEAADEVGARILDFAKDL